MIEKVGKNYETGEQEFDITCDGCGEDMKIFIDYGWSELMDIMREKGWKNIHEDDWEWHHYCPDC